MPNNVDIPSDRALNADTAYAGKLLDDLASFVGRLRFHHRITFSNSEPAITCSMLRPKGTARAHDDWRLHQPYASLLYAAGRHLRSETQLLLLTSMRTSVLSKPRAARIGEAAVCDIERSPVRDGWKLSLLAPHSWDLLMQPKPTGPDGVRKPRPHHSNGINVPTKRQASLGCVGSTDCAITRDFLRASSSQVFMPATVQYALRYDGRDRPVRSPRGSRDGMQASFSGSG